MHLSQHGDVPFPASVIDIADCWTEMSPVKGQGGHPLHHTIDTYNWENVQSFPSYTRLR